MVSRGWWAVGALTLSLWFYGTIPAACEAKALDDSPEEAGITVTFDVRSELVKNFFRSMAYKEYAQLFECMDVASQDYFAEIIVETIKDDVKQDGKPVDPAIIKADVLECLKQGDVTVCDSLWTEAAQKCNAAILQSLNWQVFPINDQKARVALSPKDGGVIVVQEKGLWKISWVETFKNNQDNNSKSEDINSKE